MEKLIDYINRERFSGADSEYLCSLEELKNSRLDLNAPDKRNFTPLMLYCEKGLVNEALYLINTQGALINAQDKFGYTPLMKAAASGKSQIITALLKHNADVSLKNIYGFTALGTALLNEQKKAAIMLIKSGADLRKDFQEKPALIKYAEKIDIQINKLNQIVIIERISESQIPPVKSNCRTRD